MLIELLSTDNYGQYNIKVAKLFGLETAVYLNELININEKAVRKNKVSDCFFVLDRDYLTSRTTLTTEQQLEIEDKLIECDVLKRKENCTLSIDIILLTNMISSEDEDLKKNLIKLTELKGKKAKGTKQKQIVENLKTNVNSGNNVLDEYLKQWVEVVSSKYGWMNKIAVQEGQNKVINASHPDIDKAIEIVKIAIINGHRDMQWAIDAYNKAHENEKKLTNFNQCVNISDAIKY